MTTPPLLALPELLAKATELPWQLMNDYQWDTIIGGIDGPDDGTMHYTTITDITVDGPQSRANARLIVAAVNALPSLLATIDAVTKECEHHAELNRVGGLRELALHARAEAAEKERDDAIRQAQLATMERDAAVAEMDMAADLHSVTSNALHATLAQCDSLRGDVEGLRAALAEIANNRAPPSFYRATAEAALTTPQSTDGATDTREAGR